MTTPTQAQALEALSALEAGRARGGHVTTGIIRDFILAHPDVPAGELPRSVYLSQGPFGTVSLYSADQMRSYGEQRYREGYAAGRAGKWLPIESAPKDGTPFLAWFQKHKLDDDGESTDEVIGGEQAIVSCDGQFWDEPQWLDSHGASYMEDWCFAETPVLWQPLPPAPQGEKK